MRSIEERAMSGLRATSLVWRQTVREIRACRRKHRILTQRLAGANRKGEAVHGHDQLDGIFPQPDANGADHRVARFRLGRQEVPSRLGTLHNIPLHGRAACTDPDDPGPGVHDQRVEYLTPELCLVVSDDASVLTLEGILDPAAVNPSRVAHVGLL